MTDLSADGFMSIEYGYSISFITFIGNIFDGISYQFLC